VAHQTTHRFGRRNDKALESFLDSGWSSSAQADAAAKAGEQGRSLCQLTLQGTKYYQDDDLNKKS
jgi:hypothetical protein